MRVWLAQKVVVVGLRMWLTHSIAQCSNFGVCIPIWCNM